MEDEKVGAADVGVSWQGWGMVTYGLQWGEPRAVAVMCPNHRGATWPIVPPGGGEMFCCHCGRPAPNSPNPMNAALNVAPPIEQPKSKSRARTS